jgi:hypothetical protein
MWRRVHVATAVYQQSDVSEGASGLGWRLVLQVCLRNVLLPVSATYDFRSSSSPNEHSTLAVLLLSYSANSGPVRRPLG